MFIKLTDVCESGISTVVGRKGTSSLGETVVETWSKAKDWAPSFEVAPESVATETEEVVIRVPLEYGA